IDEIPEQYLDRSFAGGGAKNQVGGSSWSRGSAFDRMKGKFGGDGESGKATRQTGSYFNNTGTTKSAPSYLPPKGMPPQVKEHIPSPDFQASDTSGLQPGQKVEHQKF